MFLSRFVNFALLWLLSSTVVSGSSPSSSIDSVNPTGTPSIPSSSAHVPPLPIIRTALDPDHNGTDIESVQPKPFIHLSNLTADEISQISGSNSSSTFSVISPDGTDYPIVNTIHNRHISILNCSDSSISMQLNSHEAYKSAVDTWLPDKPMVLLLDRSDCGPVSNETGYGFLLVGACLILPPVMQITCSGTAIEFNDTVGANDSPDA